MATATHLVTGATDGIGLETAAVLGGQGLRVLVHGRTEAKATAACQALAKREKAGQFEPVWGDLSSLAQVRALAAQALKLAPTLDVLINNAGLFARERTLTADGFELTMQVNHFSHFVLTHALLEALRRAPAARVVNVSSMAHARGRLALDDLTFERSFAPYDAYATSKLANVYFTHELARRLKGTAVTTSVLHPGVIDTKLLRGGFGGFRGASLASGAVTSVRCATSPEVGKVSGRYYSDGAEARCAPHANDPTLERAFYEGSCQLTGVNPLALT